MAKHLPDGFLKDCYIKYLKHGGQARQRSIPFLLTFSEWMRVWRNSGHFHKRGCNKGQYVMGRIGDKGPYAVGNVKIILNSENTIEAHLGKVRSEDTRKKIGKAAKGNKRWLGRNHSEETKRKQSESRKEYFKLDENRRKASEKTKEWYRKNSKTQIEAT